MQYKLILLHLLFTNEVTLTSFSYTLNIFPKLIAKLKFSNYSKAKHLFRILFLRNESNFKTDVNFAIDFLSLKLENSIVFMIKKRLL